MIAQDLLCRSRRATLPRRAPAPGEDSGTELGIAAAGMRGRKLVANVVFHPLSREAVVLTATQEQAVARPTDLLTGDVISRLDAQPSLSPVNASRAQSPAPAHDSGPVWVATPSAFGTFIHYTSPV